MPQVTQNEIYHDEANNFLILSDFQSNMQHALKVPEFKARTTYIFVNMHIIGKVKSLIPTRQEHTSIYLALFKSYKFL